MVSLVDGMMKMKIFSAGCAILCTILDGEMDQESGLLVLELGVWKSKNGLLNPWC